MALHFDVSTIKDHERVTTDPDDASKWHPVTSTLVQACMVVDLGMITAEGIDEWMWRLAFLDVTKRGEFLLERSSKGKEYVGRNFTREEVERHIGLRTNVSTLTRKQWCDKQMRILRSETDRKVLYRAKPAN